MVEIVVEAEHIHGSWIQLVRLVALIVNETFFLVILMLHEDPILLDIKVSFVVSTVICDFVSLLVVLIFVVVVFSSLVPLSLHFLDEYFSFWSKLHINVIRTFCQQLLHEPRPVILRLTNVSFFDLTHYENVLSLLEVLYFLVVLGEPVVVCVQLQKVLGLLTNHYSVCWSSQADTPRLFNCFASEHELGFDFTNNG